MNCRFLKLYLSCFKTNGVKITVRTLHRNSKKLIMIKHIVFIIIFIMRKIIHKLRVLNSFGYLLKTGFALLRPRSAHIHIIKAIYLSK
jgi:hypothetical protein